MHHYYRHLIFILSFSEYLHSNYVLVYKDSSNKFGNKFFFRKNLPTLPLNVKLKPPVGGSKSLLMSESFEFQPLIHIMMSYRSVVSTDSFKRPIHSETKCLTLLMSESLNHLFNLYNLSSLCVPHTCKIVLWFSLELFSFAK